MKSILEHLKFSFPLFEEELMLEIERFGSLNFFPAKTQIMSYGQSVTHFPLIVEGALKVFKENKNGDELLLYYVEPGNSCAITLKCCSGKSPSLVSAFSELDSQIIFIPVEKIEEWMSKYSTWRAYIMNVLSDRLDEMLEAVDNLAFNNLEERLKKYLKEKSFITRSHMLHLSHLEIATELNTSRVVISRLMKKLEKQQIIEQERNSVKLI